MPDSAADNDPPMNMENGSVRVRTGSRLHFGLLNTGSPFGGIGVMVDDPATEVRITPSDRWDCSTQDNDRITAIAERLSRHKTHRALPACRVEVLQRAPSHNGLGSGTQLSMAVADALCRFERMDVPPETLACKIADRGKRSAVGVHGYLHGGLIFETAVTAAKLNRIHTRVELPRQWTIVVVRPREQSDVVSGRLEKDQFDKLPLVDPTTHSELRMHIEEAIVPAAKAADFDTFADAVSRYNEASGKLFASVQGGAYNGAAITSLVQWLQKQCIAGVGQSSWGPGVFTWFEDRDAAEEFVEQLSNEIELITITAPRNRGREIFTE